MSDKNTVNLIGKIHKKANMVIKEIDSSHSNFNSALEFLSALIVAFFCAIFALWTIGSNIATVFNIPWRFLAEALKLFSPLLILFSFCFARYFAVLYYDGLLSSSISAKLPDLKSLVVVLITAFMIIASDSYVNKFYIFVIVAAALFFLSRKKQVAASEDKIVPTFRMEGRDFIALLLIVLIAVLIVLFVHRPDLDDSSFIQIATQTLANSDRAPLSFDTSLGYVLQPFRFAPYRVSSYELLVAFIADSLNISVYSVYYILLPAITAVLTVLTAFVFSRWFFPTNTLAVVATAIFFLVLLAWGETHIAYGNRVFVRLFQGKGLIIALTSPFAILTGLILANRPSYSVAGMLALANICAIGVSSSGLIMTIFTSGYVFVLAISNDFKTMIRTWILVAAAMIYPVLIAMWLKFENPSLVSFSDVGTHLPINASLGLDVRESMLMVALLFGFLLYCSNRNKSYIFLIFATFGFTLNPWLSEVISNITARNMSWRLAWAAPIPLLLSISLAAGLSVSLRNKILAVNKRLVFYGVKIAVVSIVIAFFFSYKWVFSSANNLWWGLPDHKLPNEFYVASQIADKVRVLSTTGQVLAHRDIAAWLPLTLPGVRLVMPGHTYPTQLQTILPKHDFESRMLLYNAINNGISDIEEFFKSLHDFDVRLVILPISTDNGQRVLDMKSDHVNARLEKIETFDGFELYEVIWGG